VFGRIVLVVRMIIPFSSAVQLQKVVPSLVQSTRTDSPSSKVHGMSVQLESNCSFPPSGQVELLYVNLTSWISLGEQHSKQGPSIASQLMLSPNSPFVITQSRSTATVQFPSSAVGDAVGDAVGSGEGDAVGGDVGDGVGNSVGDTVGGSVGGDVGDGVGSDVGDGVGGDVGDGVGGDVGDGVGGSVGGNVGGGVGICVGDSGVSGMTLLLALDSDFSKNLAQYASSSIPIPSVLPSLSVVVDLVLASSTTIPIFSLMKFKAFSVVARWRWVRRSDSA